MQTTTHDPQALKRGRDYDAVHRADFAALLVDAAHYYRAVRRAILTARSSVFIAGWDLHSQTLLVRGGDGDDADGDARTLREVLLRAVENNPALRIRVLLWDWAMMYAGEREMLPRVRLDWQLPAAIRLELDATVPLGASHHQKIVVVDDAVAFSGGLDLTVRRWDERRHEPGDPLRVDHEGKQFAPYHDVQLAVTGPAAAGLGAYAARRWHTATGERIEGAGEAGAEPAAEALAAVRHEAAEVFEDVPVALAYTEPGADGRRPVTQVRESVLTLIRSAEKTLYIENQFVCADAVGEALAKRLAEQPELEVLIVTPRSHKSWLESRSMGAGRARFMQHLADHGVLDRVPIVYPVIREGEDTTEVFVHAKVMIADDRFLRVGSANLNNRSMGFDTECDLIVAADSEQARARVAAALSNLLAEHLGAAPEDVAERLARDGLIATVWALNEGRRGFERIEQEPSSLTGSAAVYVSLADPERPVALREFLPFVSEETHSGEGRSRLLPLLGVLTALALLALLWKVTPLSNYAEPAALTDVLADVRASPWTHLLVPGAYVLGGFLMLPVSALILATGLAFDAGLAFVYAMTGSLASAMASYAVGRSFGAGFLERVTGGRLDPVARAVRRRGVLAMATIRNIPVAPFTVVNVVAGAARIRARDYFFGTVLGMAPGIAVIAAFGNGLSSLVGELTWTRAAQVAGLALAWVALVVVSRRVLARGDDDDAETASGGSAGS